MIDTVTLDDAAYRRYWRRRVARALGWAVLSGGWLWWRAAQLVVAVARRAPSYVEADHWLLPGYRLQGDQVTAVLAQRLQRCLRLWRPGQRWMLSGFAVDDDSRSEALAAYVFLRDHGLPPTASLLLEQQARDTCENLQSLPAAWRSAPALGLVSSRWHLARCAWLAGALGIELKLCAAERRWRPGLGEWWQVAREALALLSWAGPAVLRLQSGDLLRPRPLSSRLTTGTTHRKPVNP